MSFLARILTFLFVFAAFVNAQVIDDFQSYPTTSDLEQNWVYLDPATTKSVTLDQSGANKFVAFRFDGKSEVRCDFFSSDLSSYKVLGMRLSYPEITPENYKETESLYVKMTDSAGKSAQAEYPFSNSPWLFDQRPWVAWHINLLDFSDAGLDMQNISELIIGTHHGSGLINIDDFSFESPPVVMDFTRLLRSETVTYSSTQLTEPSLALKPEGRTYWGNSIIKDGGTYHYYAAWWGDGMDALAGGIDRFTHSDLLPAEDYTFQNTTMEPLSSLWTDPADGGEFAHNPEIFKDDDGTFYLYYLSGLEIGGAIDPENCRRQIGVASSSSPAGPWSHATEPVISMADHGDPNYPSHAGCTTYGVSNPRMIKKNGQYYLFYKVLSTFTYSDNGNKGYYLYFTAAVSSSPTGPFTMVELTGLRGRSTNYQIYEDSNAKDRGNWDVEDFCFFEYGGKHYAISKDFRGRWNRTTGVDSLVLWESNNLIDWVISDFPLITKEVREINFQDQTRKFFKAERPYFYLDDGETQGILNLSVNWNNITIPVDMSLANPSAPAEAVYDFDFDEGTGTIANDSSSPAYNGTISNAQWVSGISGTALEFDSLGDDYVHNTQNIDYSNGVTVSAWINADSFHPTDWWRHTIVSCDDYPSTFNKRGWTLRCGEGGKLGFSFGAGSSEQQINTPGQPLSTNTWHHVAATYDGSTIYLYIDGQLTDSKSISASIANPTQGLWIGRYFNANSAGDTRRFDGTIDNVRVYNTPLSLEAIRGIYHCDLPTTNDVTDGLIAHWKMDDASGSTVTDSTGSGFHGSFESSPTWTSGVDNGGLEFDGTSDAVKVDDLNGLETQNLTITGWIKRNGDQNDMSGIVFDRKSGGSAGLFFGTDNELRYQWDSIHSWITDGRDIDSGLTVPDNTWTFVALAISKEEATLYMNDGSGLQSFATTHYSDFHEFDTALHLGRDTANGSRQFKGTMDEIRIYNRTLKAAEISQLAEMQPKAVNPSPIHLNMMPSAPSQLTWTSDPSTTSRRVYFSTNYTDVRDGTIGSAADQGIVATDSWMTPTLVSTTYFWRIDTYDGLHWRKGDTWSFTLAGEMISVNFTGRNTWPNGVQNFMRVEAGASSSGVAGVNGSSVWNDLSGAIPNGGPNTTALTGIAGETASISYTVTGMWSLSGTGNRSIPNENAHGDMMDGHLEGTNPTGIDLTVSGLDEFASYDVYVYVGDDSTTNRSGTVTIGGSTQTFASKVFDGTYTLVNSAFGQGDYLLFSGLSGDSFTLTGGGLNHANRTGIRGIEIVNANPVATPFEDWAASFGVTADQTTLLDYGFGLDPTDPHDFTGVAPDLQTDFDFEVNLPDVTPLDAVYTIYGSEDLINWTTLATRTGNGSWSPLGGTSISSASLPSARRLWSFGMPTNKTAYFCRVGITLIP